jgi:hypothetical protein
MSRNISMRFRHISRPNDLVELIDWEARRLCERHPQTQRCSVVVEKPNQRHNKGNPVRAQITLSVTGKSILSSKEADGPDEMGNAAVALLSAFDAAEHSLSTYLCRRQTVVRRQATLEPVAV